MNVKHIVIAVLINSLVSTALIAIYDHSVRRPATPKFASLDISELYRVKQESLATAVAKPGATEAERASITLLAAKFGNDVESLMRAFPVECGCIVIAKPALLGDLGNIPDYTNEAKRRLGI
jgi:hypothetical protein